MDFLLPDGAFQDYGIELAKKAGSEIKSYATEEIHEKLRQWTDDCEEPEPTLKRNSPLIIPFILLIKLTFLIRDLAVFVTNTLYVILILPLDVTLVGLHFLASRMAGNPVTHSNIMSLHLSRDVLWSGVPISTGRGCRELSLPKTLVTVDAKGGSHVIKDNTRSRVKFPTSGVFTMFRRHLSRVPVLSRFFPQVMSDEAEAPVDFHTKMGALNDTLNSQLTHRAVPVAVQKSNYSSW